MRNISISRNFIRRIHNDDSFSQFIRQDFAQRPNHRRLSDAFEILNENERSKFYLERLSIKHDASFLSLSKRMFTEEEDRFSIFGNVFYRLCAHWNVSSGSTSESNHFSFFVFDAADSMQRSIHPCSMIRSKISHLFIPRLLNACSNDILCLERFLNLQASLFETR